MLVLVGTLVVIVCVMGGYVMWKVFDDYEIQNTIAPSEIDVENPETAEETDGWATRQRVGFPIADDSLLAAKQQLNEAVEELLGVIRSQDVLDAIGPTDRANLAKYLTIAKLRLENAIAVIRSGDADR